MTDAELRQIGREDDEKVILRMIEEVRAELELAELTAPPRALELTLELHRLQSLLARNTRQRRGLFEEGLLS